MSFQSENYTYKEANLINRQAVTVQFCDSELTPTTLPQLHLTETCSTSQTNMKTIFFSCIFHLLLKQLKKKVKRLYHNLFLHPQVVLNACKDTAQKMQQENERGKKSMTAKIATAPTFNLSNSHAHPVR